MWAVQVLDIYTAGARWRRKTLTKVFQRVSYVFNTTEVFILRSNVHKQKQRKKSLLLVVA